MIAAASYAFAHSKLSRVVAVKLSPALAMRARIGLRAAAMRFFSDNAAAAHPKVIEAIAASNRLDTAYDGDEWSRRLDGAFSDLFGTEVRALWVTTGTAANCLALAALCPPYRGILCHRDAHIESRRGRSARLLHRRREADPARRRRREDHAGDGRRRLRPDPQGRPPGPAGGDLDHQRDRIWPRLSRRRGCCARRAREAARPRLPHGRRPARQCAGDDRRSLADVTWRAGVDALSFGFVKNGGLNAEALILFRTELADEIAVRRKRAGHLLSKGRYARRADPRDARGRPVARQCARRQCRRADARARPRRGRLVYPVEANEIFLKRHAPRRRRGLRAQGFDFYDWGPGEIRLVTSWDQQGEAVERLAAAIAAL